MPWLKIDSRIYSHPVNGLVSPAAMWVWVSACCWLAQYPDHGAWIPKSTLRIFGARKKHVEELCAAGLWTDTGTGYEVYTRMDLAGSGLQDQLWDRGQSLERRKTIPLTLRTFVYERDDFACVECGSQEDLSLDHIFPWSMGGTDSPDNLQTLCRSCNSVKGARV